MCSGAVEVCAAGRGGGGSAACLPDSGMLPVPGASLFLRPAGTRLSSPRVSGGRGTEGTVPCAPRGRAAGVITPSKAVQRGEDDPPERCLWPWRSFPPVLNLPPR